MLSRPRVSRRESRASRRTNPARLARPSDLLPFLFPALVAFAGCEQREAPRESDGQPASAAEATGAAYGLPPFVGKIWRSTSRKQPPGSIRIFLPNKTMLMDSCYETYRIVEWGVISEDTIRWREDAVPVEARYAQPTEYSLRFTIAGQNEAENYVLADEPYVCPDMPR